jgi:hypothetical protein
MRAAFLQQAFHEIDRRWGDLPHYLKQELGIDTAEIAQLRALISSTQRPPPNGAIGGEGILTLPLLWRCRSRTIMDIN